MTRRILDGRAVYAIGDVHGRDDLLAELLDVIARDAARHPAYARPLLIFLGDYIDRGSCSREVVARLVNGWPDQFDCAREVLVPELREDPQPPAPSHPIARGRAGPGLLAHVLFAKYGLHLPLTRQSATYARESIELDVSTLADWVGASTATLMPLVEAVRGHVFAAERIHADDTTVPVLDVGRTRTGRLWTYVRDDRPFAGTGPPAAAYFYSPDRRGEHPEAHLASWAGLMQADAYAGYDRSA